MMIDSPPTQNPFDLPGRSGPPKARSRTSIDQPQPPTPPTAAPTVPDMPQALGAMGANLPGGVVGDSAPTSGLGTMAAPIGALGASLAQVDPRGSQPIQYNDSSMPPDNGALIQALLARMGSSGGTIPQNRMPQLIGKM